MTLAQSKTAVEAATFENPNAPTYERDFYTWALEQAALHPRRPSCGGGSRECSGGDREGWRVSEFSKLVSFYRLILLHMLKWEHQPNLRSRSWANLD